MVRSTCPKAGCDNHSFELAEASINGAKYKMYFVQCARCGTVVGVTEYYNLGARIDTLAKKLNVNLDR